MDNIKTWVCNVCGYVHHGETPPENCPVCGAPAELFSLKEDSNMPAKPEDKPSAWRCLNCEFIHEGAAPPEPTCPVCGAPQDRFEPFKTEKDSTLIEAADEKIIIIGAGIAGMSAAEAVREKSREAPVSLFSNDSIPPYYRLNLTRYLAGETEEKNLPLKPEEWYKENAITLKLNSEVCEIDNGEKFIRLKNGETYNYTKLIIASGSHAFMPPFPGSNKKNIIMMRHKRDADAILEAAANGAKCICIGGGILGLETAAALAKRNVDVTVIEGHGWLLPRQLNKAGGDILEKYAENMGIKFIKAVRVKEFIGDETAGEVLLEDGSSISGDLFIITTGVRSNTYFARKAGLEVNKGIIVNDYLKTSDDNIWAAGDVCEHRGVTYGAWGPAQFQGTMAGMNALGINAEFHGIPRSNILKVMGLDLFSIGKILPEDASCIEIKENKNDNYYCFFLKDNYLIGTILIGDTSISAKVKNAIEQKIDFSEAMEYDRSLEKILKILKNS